jgi:hypothetical protein
MNIFGTNIYGTQQIARFTSDERIRQAERARQVRIAKAARAAAGHHEPFAPSRRRPVMAWAFRREAAAG